jgi:hypothetical protein
VVAAAEQAIEKEAEEVGGGKRKPRRSKGGTGI